MFLPMPVGHAAHIPNISNPQPKSDQVVPMELQETMQKTVAYALDFIPDTLDYSPASRRF
jgi:hypothetical protein